MICKIPDVARVASYFSRKHSESERQKGGRTHITYGLVWGGPGDNAAGFSKWLIGGGWAVISPSVSTVLGKDRWTVGGGISTSHHGLSSTTGLHPAIP